MANNPTNTIMSQEHSEEKLAQLIQQAGDDARALRRKVLKEHFAKLRTTIISVMTRERNSGKEA